MCRQGALAGGFCRGFDKQGSSSGCSLGHLGGDSLNLYLCGLNAPLLLLISILILLNGLNSPYSIFQYLFSKRTERAVLYILCTVHQRHYSVKCKPMPPSLLLYTEGFKVL